MDTAVGLPTIRASEIEDKAASFARDLTERLDALDQQYPIAEMSQKEKDNLTKTLGDLGPSPQQFTQVFKRLFFSYMTSRFVVIPD